MTSTLNYVISSAPDWMRLSTAGVLIADTPPRVTANRQYQISITATDEDGKSTNTILNVEVIITLYVKIKIFLEGMFQ